MEQEKPSIKHDLKELLEGAGVDGTNIIGKWTHDKVHELVQARDREVSEGKEQGYYADAIRDSILEDCRKDPEKRKAWEKTQKYCIEIADYVNTLEFLKDGEPAHVKIAFEKSEQMQKLIKDMDLGAGTRSA